MALYEGNFIGQGNALRMLTNASLGEMAPNYGFGSDLLTIVDEQELLGIFGNDYRSAMVRGYKNELTASELAAAAKILTDALPEFTPDIVITYTTAPALRAAFPEALILHMEYGLYSRAPFPESFYLDPLGKFSNSTLGQYKSELKSCVPTDAERALARKFKHHFVEGILRPKSPFNVVSDTFRDRYRSLLLLPLQYSGHYGFDGTCSYENQEDLLHDVMNHVHEDTCVLALQHPSDVHITHETIDSMLLETLKKRHENLIMANEFNKFLFPSQFMLAHVDAVASVSSSVALQGLLWDTTIIALGHSHLNTISDHEGVQALGGIETTSDEETKSSMLSWLLSHYYIPVSYLHDPDWIANYLSNSLDKWRQGLRGLDYFDPIDDPDRMAQKICDAAMPNVPVVVTDEAS